MSRPTIAFAVPAWAFALLIGSIAMAWPALLNRQPAYFFDTPSYYNVGNAALASVRAKIGAPPAGPATNGAATNGVATNGVATNGVAAAAAVSNQAVVATRAVAYSVFAYLTSWPAARMYLTVAVQSLVASAMLLLWWTRVAPGLGWRRATLAGLAVAALTSAPWFASFAMPDIFAGVALLGYLVLLQPSPAPLGNTARLFVVLTIAFAFTVHVSHIPMLLFVSGFAVAQHLWTHRARLQVSDAREVAWLSAPVLLGVVLVLGTSAVGFSEVSLAPKRLPLVLARSIEDGPGRWYLEKTCPTRKYVICDMFPVMPRRQVDLMWGPNGLRARATPEQMDAIRREEPEIVAAAARAYPLHQASRALQAFGHQTFAFGLLDVDFGRNVRLRGDARMVLEEGGVERLPLRPIMNLVIYGSALGATLYLVRSAVRAPRSKVAHIVILVFVALLANAAVTGILSAVAQRYQSRVIWVVPVFALGLYLAHREADRGRREGVDAQP